MYNLRKAPMFPILTDPDILLHVSCTPAGDKGSKLSLQPALMDKFIPLKGQTLYEAVVLQTLQKCWLHLLEKIWVTHTHIHKKKEKKKKKKDFPLFSSFQARRNLHHKKRAKRHIALHVILENICRLLGAHGEREKKLMKNKITRESLLMITAFFFQQALLYSSPCASLLGLPGTTRAAKSPVAQRLCLLCQKAVNEQPGDSWGVLPVGLVLGEMPWWSWGCRVAFARVLGPPYDNTQCPTQGHLHVDVLFWFPGW